MILEFEPGKREFLAALYEWGTVGMACRETGLNRMLVDKWMEEDKGFVRQVKMVVEDVGDRMESRLVKAADSLDGKAGVDASVAWLKANKPEKYVERHQVVHTETPAALKALEEFTRLVQERRGLALPEPANIVDMTDYDNEER